MSVQASGSLVLGGAGGPSPSNLNPLQSHHYSHHAHHQQLPQHHHHQQQLLSSLDPITTTGSGIAVNLPQTPEDPNSLQHHLGGSAKDLGSYHHGGGVVLKDTTGLPGLQRIVATALTDPSGVPASQHHHLKDPSLGSPPGLKDTYPLVGPAGGNGLIHHPDHGSASGISSSNSVVSGGAAAATCATSSSSASSSAAAAIAASTVPVLTSAISQGEENEIQSQEASSTDPGDGGGKNGGKKNNHGRVIKKKLALGLDVLTYSFS